MKNKRIKNRINNFSKKNCKAAMEMSVGTIVTIVLLMSVLVLGIVLTKNIFESSKGAIDMTDQQLQSEISKLFASEKPVLVYPTSGTLEIKHGNSDALGIGIKNMVNDDQTSNTFSYNVEVSDSNDCGNFDVSRWIKLGSAVEGIDLLKGNDFSKKIIFEIPEGSPICTAEFVVKVKYDGQTWKNEFFYVKVK